MNFGVFIYGPPASGKSYLTEHLSESLGFSVCKRIKAGGVPSDEYENISPEQYWKMHAAGDILWSNARYGAIYAVSKASLRRSINTGSPVVSVGQPEAIDALRKTHLVEWSICQLWCPEEVAVERLKNRPVSNLDERLEAWKNTKIIDSRWFFDTSTVGVSTIISSLRNALVDRVIPS